MKCIVSIIIIIWYLDRDVSANYPKEKKIASLPSLLIQILWKDEQGGFSPSPISCFSDSSGLGESFLSPLKFSSLDHLQEIIGDFH